ncbi:MAG: hypothetical protein Q8L55_01425 [Phycisphaerales bacterium]|nr:hypothetical protein [Phycisphaerales bacterium]
MWVKGDSMRARGLAASVIVTAVANRWVRGLLHQMKEPLAGNGSGVTMAA